MHLSLSLFLWLWRRSLAATIVAVVLAVGLMLLVPDRLQPQFARNWMPLYLMLAFAHAVAVVAFQGRPFSGPTGYLYSRGFTRDRLWVHQVLASVVSVLVVWLVAGTVVWLPLRGWWQGTVMNNPFYPGADALEGGFVLRPLALALWLVPMLHYSWIRRAQPTRDRLVGPMLLAWALLGGLWSFLPSGTRGFALLPWIAAMVIALPVSLTVLGWRLHRRMEVGR